MATPTNLPAAFTVGQVLTSTQQNDLRGAFRVLQVVSATTNTIVSNTTSTFADTGLTVNITCQSTDSKVFVIVSQTFSKNSGNVNNAVIARIMRGATEISRFSGAALYTGSALDLVGPCGTATLLDSPASISALTYKTQFANFTNANGVGANTNNGVGTITLLEISA